MKLQLTPAERRALRAQAHHLAPVVMIGNDGLTPPVLHEIDVNLAAHGLIKIRVFGDDRDAREQMLDRICAVLNSAPVQHIGKLLIVYRPLPVAPRTRERHPAGDERRPPPRRPRPGVRTVAREAAVDRGRGSARERRDERAAAGRRTPAGPSAPRGIPGRRRRPG